jgi:hypothetical protein
VSPANDDDVMEHFLIGNCQVPIADLKTAAH